MNYNELHDHKRSDTIKWIIAFTLIAVLFVGFIGSAIFVFGSTDTKKENEPATEITTPVNPVEENNVGVEAQAQPMVALAVSPRFAAAVSETGQTTVSKTITATVLPVDAPDKSVDWTIEWCIPIEGAEVTDYITVTPESDGSLTATITAYQGFEGASAYVTATTRVGGFSAQCLVMYDGAPESLSFVCNGVEYGNTDTIEVTAGSTYSVNLNLKNTLNAVGSKYGNFEVVTVKGQGRFTMNKQYIVNGSVKSTEEIVFNLETGSYSYKNEVSGATETLTITPEQFFTASISGDVMTIKAIKSESSYVNGYPRTGYKFTYKGTYTDPRSGGVADNCVWYVLVRDTVSGEEALLHIDINSTVTSISLSNSSIAF